MIHLENGEEIITAEELLTLSGHTHCYYSSHKRHDKPLPPHMQPYRYLVAGEKGGPLFLRSQLKKERQHVDQHKELMAQRRRDRALAYYYQNKGKNNG